MSRRDDVVSALVLVSSSEGLRTAAVWPRGTPAQHALADAARSTFASGSVVVRTDQDLLIPVRSMRGSEEPVHDPVAPDTAPADTDVALRAQRVMAKPIFSRGRRVGALAFALREDAPFEPTRTSAPPTTTPTPPAPSSTRMGVNAGNSAPPTSADSSPRSAPKSSSAASQATSRTNVRQSVQPIAEPATPSRATRASAASRPAPDNGRATANDAARLLDLVAVALSHEGLDRSAAAVADELAVACDCDRVAIGLSSRRLIEVVALSHGADLKGRSRELREIAAAMDEAADQSVTVRFPPQPEDRPLITLAHAELAQRQAAGALCTVPMARDGRIVGAVTFERRSARPFEQSTIDLAEDAVALLGELFALKQQVEEAPIARLGAMVAAYPARLFGAGHNRLKVVSAAIVALAAALTLIPVPASVVAPAHIEGAVQRVLVAPADGFLKQVHARPGDSVRAGQLLAELADEDLQLELRRWENEVGRHETAFAEALARQDRAQVVIAQARAGEARAQLEVVRSHIERSRLVAPFDGVLIKGDLKQQLGAPVRKGDTLLTLAPFEQFRVILDIEDRDVARVSAGTTGRIALSARPDDTHAIRIVRIKPVATTVDGRNVFETEATFEGPGPRDLRPGLEGVGKIEGGTRPLYWIIGNRAFDWLRMTFWSLSR